MSAVFSSSDDADAVPACSSVPDVSVREHSSTPIAGVGPQRHSHIAIRELEAHAASCHYLMQLAKAKYRGSKALADAQEAGRWLVLKEEAQKAVLALRRELMRDVA